MALKMNGQYMRIRDKGPLFIVYLTTAVLGTEPDLLFPINTGKFQR